MASSHRSLPISPGSSVGCSVLGVTCLCQVVQGSEDELVNEWPAGLRRKVPPRLLAHGDQPLSASHGEAIARPSRGPADIAASAAPGLACAAAEEPEAADSVDSDEEGSLPSEYSFFGGVPEGLRPRGGKADDGTEGEGDSSTDANDLSADTVSQNDSDAEDLAPTPRLEKSASFFAACRELPRPEAVDGMELICEERLPHATLEGVRDALFSAEEMVVQRFFREVFQCRDMRASAWAPCARMPGTWVKVCHCLMPIPRDVAAAVQAVLSIPEDSEATIAYRLQDRGEEGISLVVQNANKDMPLGERFRVQENLSFQRHPDGGIRFRRWGSIIWTTELPWALSFIRGIIREKTMTKAAATLPSYMRLMEDATSGRREGAASM